MSYSSALLQLRTLLNKRTTENCVYFFIPVIPVLVVRAQLRYNRPVDVHVESRTPPARSNRRRAVTIPRKRNSDTTSLSTARTSPTDDGAAASRIDKL